MSVETTTILQEADLIAVRLYESMSLKEPAVHLIEVRPDTPADIIQYLGDGINKAAKGTLSFLILPSGIMAAIHPMTPDQARNTRDAILKNWDNAIAAMEKFPNG